MLTRDIINYDSAWEAVVEAASDPSSLGGGASRDLLTDQELQDLCGVPAITVFSDGAPACLPDETTPNPARSAFLKAQAEAKGWEPTERFNWGSMGRTPFSQVFFHFRPVENTCPPLLRLGPSYGDEFNLTGPLRHRLRGDMKRTAAVIVQSDSNCAEALRLTPSTCDTLFLTQLHEMFHILQLFEVKPVDFLLARVCREHDAENGAVTAFQTFASGSPVTVARAMLGRMSTIFETSANYYFWPNLPVESLRYGPSCVNGAAAYALHMRAGVPLPDPELVEMWSLLQAGVLREDICAQHGPGLDRMTDLAVEQCADGRLAAIFEGLSFLEERQPAEVPDYITGFAEKYLQARRIVGALGARDVKTPTFS